MRTHMHGVCVTLCALVHACILRDQSTSDPLELELQVVV